MLVQCLQIHLHALRLMNSVFKVLCLCVSLLTHNDFTGAWHCMALLMERLHNLGVELVDLMIRVPRMSASKGNTSQSNG